MPYFSYVVLGDIYKYISVVFSVVNSQRSLQVNCTDFSESFSYAVF